MGGVAQDRLKYGSGISTQPQTAPATYKIVDGKFVKQETPSQTEQKTNSGSLIEGTDTLTIINKDTGEVVRQGTTGGSGSGGGSRGGGGTGLPSVTGEGQISQITQQDIERITGSQPSKTLNLQQEIQLKNQLSKNIQEASFDTRFGFDSKTLSNASKYLDIPQNKRSPQMQADINYAYYATPAQKKYQLQQELRKKIAEEPNQFNQPNKQQIAGSRRKKQGNILERLGKTSEEAEKNISEGKLSGGLQKEGQILQNIGKELYEQKPKIPFFSNNSRIQKIYERAPLITPKKENLSSFLTVLTFPSKLGGSIISGIGQTVETGGNIIELASKRKTWEDAGNAAIGAGKYLIDVGHTADISFYEKDLKGHKIKSPIPIITPSKKVKEDIEKSTVLIGDIATGVVQEFITSPIKATGELIGSGIVIGGATSLAKTVTPMLTETAGTARAITVVSTKKAIRPIKKILQPSAKYIEPLTTQTKTVIITPIKNIAGQTIRATTKIKDYPIKKINLLNETITEATLPIRVKTELTKRILIENTKSKLENITGQAKLTLESAKIKTLKKLPKLDGLTQLKILKTKRNILSGIENIKGRTALTKTQLVNKFEPLTEKISNKISSTKIKLNTIGENITSKTSNLKTQAKLAKENIQYKASSVFDDIKPKTVKLKKLSGVGSLVKSKVKFFETKTKARIIKAQRKINIVKESVQSGVEKQRIKLQPLETKVRKFASEVEQEKTLKKATQFKKAFEVNRAQVEEALVQNIRTPFSKKSIDLILKDYPSEYAGTKELRSLFAKKQYFAQVSPSKSPFIKGGTVKKIPGAANIERGLAGEIVPNASETGFFVSPQTKDMLPEFRPSLVKAKKTAIKDIGNKKSIIEDGATKNVYAVAKQRGDIIGGSRSLKAVYKDFPRKPADFDIYSINPKASSEFYATALRQTGKKVEIVLDKAPKYGKTGKYILQDPKTKIKFLELEKVVEGTDFSKVPFIKKEGVKFASPRKIFETKVEQASVGIAKGETKALKDLQFLTGNKIDTSLIKKNPSVAQAYVYYARGGEQGGLLDLISGRAKLGSGNKSITIIKGQAQKGIPDKLLVKNTPIKAFERAELDDFFKSIESPKYKGKFSPYVLDKSGKPTIDPLTGKKVTIRETVINKLGEKRLVEYIRANKYYEGLGYDIINPGIAGQVGVRGEFEAILPPVTKLKGLTTTRLGKAKQLFNIPEQKIKTSKGTFGLSFAEIQVPAKITRADELMALKKVFTPKKNYNVPAYMTKTKPVKTSSLIKSPERNIVGKTINRIIPSKISNQPTLYYNPTRLLKAPIRTGVSFLNRRLISSPSIARTSISGVTSYSKPKSLINLLSSKLSSSNKASSRLFGGSSKKSSSSTSSSGSISFLSSVSDSSSGKSSSGSSSTSISTSVSKSSGRSSSGSLIKRPKEKIIKSSIKRQSSMNRIGAHAYDVYVRKTLPGTKQVAPQLVARNVPLNTGINEGTRIASRYTQRTVQLKRTGYTNMPDESLNRQRLMQYRGFKPTSKIKRQTINLVEKSKHAIDSYEEKQGIPYKGQQVRKKQALQRRLRLI